MTEDKVDQNMVQNAQKKLKLKEINNMPRRREVPKREILA